MNGACRLVHVRLGNPFGREIPLQMQEDRTNSRPYKYNRLFVLIARLLAINPASPCRSNPTDWFHRTIYSRTRYTGSLMRRSTAKTYPVYNAPGCVLGRGKYSVGTVDIALSMLVLRADCMESIRLLLRISPPYPHSGGMRTVISFGYINGDSHADRFQLWLHKNLRFMQFVFIFYTVDCSTFAYLFSLRAFYGL